MKIVVFDTETNGLLPRNIDIKHKVSNQYLIFPEIVQFAYIVFDTETKEVIHEFSNIILPPVDFFMPPECTAIHGITKEQIQTTGLPLIAEILNFHSFCKDADFIVGHNIKFDIDMIVAFTFKFVKVSLNESWHLFAENRPETTKEEEKKILFDSELTFKIQEIKNDFCYHFERKFFCTMKNSVNLVKLPFKNINNFGKLSFKNPKLSELFKFFFPHWSLETSNVKLHHALTDVYICFMCYLELMKEVEETNVEMQTNNWNRLLAI